MKLNLSQLEAAFLLAQKTLETQDLPDFMKDRWWRALEKAKAKLVEQPYFAWQSESLTIVSIPDKKKEKTFCRFYRVTGEICHRVDKLGYCQAFYDGFPCWHRGAFLLLGIYFGEAGEIRLDKSQVSLKVSTKVGNSANQKCQL